MSDSEYLSTGEAAKVLGISRSTVARRFDEGALRGKAHPITGERLISNESITHFFEDHIHAGAHYRDIALFEHRRRWPRYSVHLPCTLELYVTDKPLEDTRGGAVVDNISLDGAGLSHIQFDAHCIPTESFRILMEIDHPLLPAWSAYCQVIRLHVNGQLSAGLQFMHITKSCCDKIAALDRRDRLQVVP
jgi:excisionase family DNA binding protein